MFEEELMKQRPFVAQCTGMVVGSMWESLLVFREIPRFNDPRPSTAFWSLRLWSRSR
jgi:hypothetical protein